MKIIEDGQEIGDLGVVHQENHSPKYPWLHYAVYVTGSVSIHCERCDQASCVQMPQWPGLDMETALMVKDIAVAMIDDFTLRHREC